MAMMVIGRHAVVAQFGWAGHNHHREQKQVISRKRILSTRSRGRVA